MFEALKWVGSKLRLNAQALTMALMLFVFAAIASPGAFAADIPLPTTGVNMGDYVGGLLTNLGGVIGVAIGAGFAIFALWMGFKYVKSAIRGG